MQGRGWLPMSVLVLGLAALTACTKIPGVQTGSVEDRMRSGCASGPAGAPAASILDIRVGMAATEALRTLKCYDDTANLEYGTIGPYAHEVDQLVRELNGGKSGYTNLMLWTRGDPRPCGPAPASSGQSELDRNLRPDDERFADYVTTGNGNQSGFKCYSKIRDQIAVRLGGAPDSAVVVGVWRLNLPPDGSRPPLATVLAGFNAKYPALRLDPAAKIDTGFSGGAFTDETGARLEDAQIAADYASLAAPTEPTPPATTQPCGFLNLESCARQPPQIELDQYEAAKAAYAQAQTSYAARKAAADKYGKCVTSPPKDPGEATLDETLDTVCGPSFYVAATPYPGGFAEAIYAGVYDPRVARAARLKLDDYVRSRRGETGPHSNQAPPPL